MKNIRLLWVDDEYVPHQEEPHANYLWYYHSSMVTAGFAVDHAAGPDGVLKRLRKGPKYQGLLLDIILPPEEAYSKADHRGWRLTGVLLAEAISKLHRDLPIIVLTNSKNEEAWHRLRRIKQVKEILSKPDCTPGDLIARLREVLGVE